MILYKDNWEIVTFCALWLDWQNTIGLFKDCLSITTSKMDTF